MDIDTTNIDELPIQNNIPVNNNNDEIVEQIPINSENITLDSKIQINNNNKKNVTFDDSVQNIEKQPLVNINNNKHEEDPNDILTIEYKIVILSTILFFIFMDKKFKIYIINILAQIFGSYLKTDMGNISNIGIVFYSLFFGLTLISCIKIIDISSIKLIF
tara:strand:- start:23 stop:505 length:483 start_codon:yes stop_codon:yes gene_type:complete